MNLAIAVLLGAGIGLGFIMLVRAARYKPTPLADVITALDRQAPSIAELAKTPAVGFGELATWQQRLGRTGIRAMESLGFIDVGILRDRLRVLDKSIERHAYEKVFAAVVAFALPIAMGVVLQLGGVSVSIVFVLLSSCVLSVAGFLYPDLPLGQEVEKRQQSFRHALSSYLDLVTIILAGGGGIESALEGAAEAGDGWAFAEIRGALRRASLTRRSPWEVFDELGVDLGVTELRELASSVALAGGQGAKVKQSLNAKADSMRAAQAARLELTAEVQTEKMTAPVVLLLMGLVLFLGYGAVSAISTGSSNDGAEPTQVFTDGEAAPAPTASTPTNQPSPTTGSRAT